MWREMGKIKRVELNPLCSSPPNFFQFSKDRKLAFFGTVQNFRERFGQAPYSFFINKDFSFYLINNHRLSWAATQHHHVGRSTKFSVTDVFRSGLPRLCSDVAYIIATSAMHLVNRTWLIGSNSREIYLPSKIITADGLASRDAIYTSLCSLFESKS